MQTGDWRGWLKAVSLLLTHPDVGRFVKSVTARRWTVSPRIAPETLSPRKFGACVNKKVPARSISSTLELVEPAVLFQSDPHRCGTHPKLLAKFGADSIKAHVWVFLGLKPRCPDLLDNLLKAGL